MFALTRHSAVAGRSMARAFSGRKPTIWDPPDFDHIFAANRKWVKEKTDKNPDYFTNLAKGQKPKYLLIGCADSRVGAQEIMGMDAGELFVHRNIANVVVKTDLNMLSVLAYSVNVLGVEDIFVLGHYACGGVRAASSNNDHGLIEHWLHNIRDVGRLHASELNAIKDPEEKHRRLVELNVQEQCMNLWGNSIVQKKQAEGGRPRVHGMVYDISNGYLKYLNIDFKSMVKEYRHIYQVTDFAKAVRLSDKTGKEIHVVISSASGNAIPAMTCVASDKVKDVKEYVAKAIGTTVDQIELEHQGRKLKSDKTLEEEGINHICELQQTFNLTPKNFKK